MTINVYHYNGAGEADIQYTLREGEEFSGLLLDEKTFIVARAGKEDEGFKITFPLDIEKYLGKRAFNSGDVLPLSEGYELAADVDDSENE